MVGSFGLTQSVTIARSDYNVTGIWDDRFRSKLSFKSLWILKYVTQLSVKEEVDKIW